MTLEQKRQQLLAIHYTESNIYHERSNDADTEWVYDQEKLISECRSLIAAFDEVEKFINQHRT